MSYEEAALFVTPDSIVWWNKFSIQTAKLIILSRFTNTENESSFGRVIQGNFSRPTFASEGRNGSFLCPNDTEPWLELGCSKLCVIHKKLEKFTRGEQDWALLNHKIIDWESIKS